MERTLDMLSWKDRAIRVLILEKNIAFYKVDDEKRSYHYAFVDQRQDYVNIIRGLWLKVDTKWLSKLGKGPSFDIKVY